MLKEEKYEKISEAYSSFSRVDKTSDDKITYFVLKEISEKAQKEYLDILLKWSPAPTLIFILENDR